MNEIVSRRSLSEALSKVEKIEMLVESGFTVDDAMVHTLGDISDLPVDRAAGLTDAVNRYIAVFDAFKMKSDFINDQMKRTKARKVSIENAEKRFKDRVLFFINEHPNIMLQGTERGFRKKMHGGKPSMKLNFDPYDMRDLVTWEQIQEHEIPEDCYKELVVYKLDKEAIRNHMKQDHEKGHEILSREGEAIEGSSKYGHLERGHRLTVE